MNDNKGYYGMQDGDVIRKQKVMRPTKKKRGYMRELMRKKNARQRPKEHHRDA